ncbi:archease [bacterium]|nr:archease [candidate division CSSED10-310 bacterium]
MKAAVTRCQYGLIREIATTADTALQIRALSVSELFAAAGWGLSWLLIDPVIAAESVTREVDLSAGDLEELLVEWLTELLYIFDVDHLVFFEFELTVTEQRVVGCIRGFRFDPSRMALKTAVKAVTWHALSVRRSVRGCRAHILFDL